MAEEKNYFEHHPQNVFQRLVCNKAKSENNLFLEIENFKPVINPVSEEIDFNINMGSNRPRWERLYNLQDDKKQQIEQILKEKELESVQIDEE